MEQSTQVRRRHTNKQPAGTAAGKPRLPGPPGRLLPRAFVEAPPELVAPRLLGRLLAHRTRFGWVTGRIVEAEAYLGPHNNPPDPAAHSYRGPTPRNLVIFGPAGYAYVYSIYGRYFCMNVSCEVEGQAGCVLLRALEPVGKLSFVQMARNRGLKPDAPIQQLASGPSRLCQALDLTRPVHNGLNLLDPKSPLQLRDDGFIASEALVTVRIGIKHAIDLPLRFLLPGHVCASGPKKMTNGLPGTRIILR
ncbi:MAG TPA: DNA-3-methyladenine glycosylase [Terracidiphilus sp.]|nr:DNA-3-methyladenine glycosylase [Terracidiphilus sp.]